MLAFFLASTGLMAQETTVTGRVMDATENSPLPGVTILVKGTSIGTITDIDGNFSIKATPEDVLLFSFIGFQSQEVPVGAQRVINVDMDTDMTALDEVVVIGYGTQLKKVVTAATAQVTGEELEKRSITNAFQAMQGQAAGVNIRSISGQPGEGFKINIRGLGTIGNGEPLYIVDGVQTGDIKYLNNADIQSIDVLKDAASAAIYGSRAANGVVLITTKKGRPGEGSISFDGYYGVQNLAKKIELLDSREYAQIINEQHLNSGGAINSLPFSVSNLPAYTSDGSANTDWIDEMFVKNALTKNYTIGMNGGNDQSLYSVSFSYTGQEGILGGSRQSNYDRYGARINTENKLYNGKLKIGENLSYTYVDKNGVSVGNQYSNTLRGAFNTSPLLPVYDDEGNFFNTADESILDQNGNEYWNNTESNPYASMVLTNQNKRNEQKLFANAFAELEIIKDLKFRTSIGIDHYSDEYRSYTPVYQLSVYALAANDKVTQSMKRTRTLQLDNTLNYRFDLGAQSFDFMIGTSTRDYHGSWMSASNSNLAFDDFDHAWLNNASNQEFQLLSITGAPEEADKLLSYFGRIQYDFKKKYLLNATFRADGSSKFAPGNQWGYFPSVSAGWVISDEPFLKSMSIVNFMKFRASWGRNGNQNIPAFQFLSPISFRFAGYAFGDTEGVSVPGSFPERLPNPDVKWETSEQIDFGLDTRILSNRLLIAFDWYKKSTIDWLITPPILATAGANPPAINGGRIENTGVELELTFEHNIGKLNYSVSANAAYNDNNVKDIPTEDRIVHGAANTLYANSSEFYRAEAGHPIGYFWGYETNGLFQNSEEVAAYTNTEGEVIQPNAKPGDVRYVDQNGDGTINNEDKVEIGNPNPPLSFGLTLSADYKGFDLSIMTFGMAGHQIVQSYRDHSGKFNNYTTDILDRWTGEGTSNTIPRVTNGNINYQFSELFVQDGAYYRIGNLTLGYDFTSLVNFEKVSKFRLFVAVNNLYTFTKYTGMDPDVGYGLDNGFQDKFSSGVDLGYYPNPRTVMVGANVKF